MRVQGLPGSELLKGDGATPFAASFEPFGWDLQINGTTRTAL